MLAYPYGIGSEGEMSKLDLELAAFRLNGPQCLGRDEHFWRIVEILWNDPKKRDTYFERNPWSERMAYYAARHNYLAVLGCASSSKSDFFSLWGIVSWLADPTRTLVMVTSTTLKDSRRRIWGRIVQYFNAVPGLPGKLVDSAFTIQTNDGTGTFTDNRGICLIAGEKKKEKESVGKMIGMKQVNVILIADELPELSEAILEAGFSNLSANPNFQLIGIGNFASIYDPLGVFARPAKGWGSVNPNDEEWETERGYCIRFDGMKSPNLLLGEDKWPYLYNSKTWSGHKKVYGENSPELWRMCRSFPCPAGEESTIYSESDFIRGDAHGNTIWSEPPVALCAADPGFTNGGDKFAVVYGLYGKNSVGLSTLQVTGLDYLYENVDLTRAGEPRDFQTATQLTDRARDHKVAKNNLTTDCSGPGGLAYGSIVSKIWGYGFLPVKFGESPSERLVSHDDPRKCCDAFANKAAEMWFAGRNFIRAGQIKGLPQEVARQLKSRLYETYKAGANLKMKLESKDDMRLRIRMSPDAADAFLMLVELARERFGFTPGERSGQAHVEDKAKSWQSMADAAHSVYHPELSYTDA